MAELQLDTRAGWPQDLRVLLDRYPREVWPAHANLGDEEDLIIPLILDRSEQKLGVA